MGHFKNLEITKESEFVPEQETTMSRKERQEHEWLNERALKILKDVLDHRFKGEKDSARQRIIRSALRRVAREVRK